VKRERKHSGGSRGSDPAKVGPEDQLRLHQNRHHISAKAFCSVGLSRFKCLRRWVHRSFLAASIASAVQVVAKCEEGAEEAGPNQ